MFLGCFIAVCSNGKSLRTAKAGIHNIRTQSDAFFHAVSEWLLAVTQEVGSDLEGTFRQAS